MAGDAGGKERCGREVIHCATIFYKDYGLVASTEPVWFQVLFDTLTGVCHGGDLEKLQEDGRDDLPPLPCGGDPVGSNLQATDDRGGFIY